MPTMELTRQRTGPVLIVDDQPLHCKLLERILEIEGYETLVADSIAEAKEIISETIPALVVVDVRLIDGDGLVLAHQLKSAPRTAACAVLACSAAVAPGERMRALAAGCEDYIAKPIDISRFVRVVGSLAAPAGSRARAFV
jgi:two-component system cell cycle response regulator DivK